jgi:hypothetical protein
MRLSKMHYTQRFVQSVNQSGQDHTHCIDIAFVDQVLEKRTVKVIAIKVLNVWLLIIYTKKESKHEKTLTIYGVRNSCWSHDIYSMYVTCIHGNCHYILSNTWTNDVTTVVFRCPQVSWQSQTPIRFPEVKQGLISGIRRWKTLIWMSSLPESRWWYFYFPQKIEELRLYNLA